MIHCKWPDVCSQLGFYVDRIDVDPLDMMDFSASNGVGWVEFDLHGMNWFPDQIKGKTVKAIKKHAKSKKLKIGCRLPADLDYLSLHHNIHQAVMSRTIEFIELASDIGAESLTVSLPTLPFFPGEPDPSPITTRYPKAIEEALSRSLHLLFAFSDDVPISIVNTNGQLTNPIIQKCLHESLKRDEVRLCLDVGGYFYSNLSELSFFEANSHHIQKIYLHDATSLSDHLSIGKGKLDFDVMLKPVANDFEGPIILKAKSRSGLTESLQQFQATLCSDE